MFKRALLEGFKNIIRSFWLSATAISVLVVSLASVTLIATLSTTVSFTVRNLDKLITIRAILREDFPEEKVPELQQIISTIPGTTKDQIVYFDREKAKTDLLEDNKSRLSEDFINRQLSNEENLTWRFVEITPVSSDFYGEIIQGLKDIKIAGVENIWEEIPRNESFVDRLVSLNNWVRIIGLVLIFVFAAISILVMANILRITIYSHREEIEIMRLVGATNNYIRAPFIAEGVYHNLIAATIVVAFFIPGLNIIMPNIQGWIGGGNFISDSSNLLIQIYFALAATIVVGIIIGIITTFLAIQKYLKL